MTPEVTEPAVCASATEILPPHPAANSETHPNMQAPERRAHPIVMMPRRPMDSRTAECSGDVTPRPSSPNIDGANRNDFNLKSFQFYSPARPQFARTLPASHHRISRVITLCANLLGAPRKKALAPGRDSPKYRTCPIRTCLWLRAGRRGPGQEASQPPLKRPAAGGEPANPAQRGTRLEATTDRAFLVSAGPPKAGAQRGLSILPGVRTGLSSSKRWP